ncbi:MAG: reprolysin-like metallopeptidase [Blastocatellia bacterium]
MAIRRCHFYLGTRGMDMRTSRMNIALFFRGSRYSAFFHSVWMGIAVAAICLALWRGIVRPAASAAAGPAEEQGSLWRDESDAMARGRNVRGASRVLRLNRRMMARLLAGAPVESRSRAGGRLAELPLPLPDGSFVRFRIEESPIMEPSMAERYPEIRTYTGQGLEDPTASMRCDLTPQGFHATVLTRDGSVTIQSTMAGMAGMAGGVGGAVGGAGDPEQYVSYLGKDSQDAAEPVQCEAGEPADPRLIERQERRGRAPSSAALVTGATLRTYRIAVAANWEYCNTFGGGTNSGTIASIVTWLNAVNAVYERELTVRLLLVNNTNILYTAERGFTSTTDPFTNGSASTMLGELRPVLGNASLISLSSFDLGHVMGTGGAGVANLGVVCDDYNYLGGPIKSSGVSLMGGSVGNSTYVGLFAHELGHQFGAYHSFNATSGSICGPSRTGISAYESGSGMTLMSYAGNCSSDNIATSSDLRFHIGSIAQIQAHIDYEATCAAPVSTGNAAPSVSAGADYTIPRNTPFMLTATGSDPNSSDAPNLTYVWEQIDAGGSSYGNPPYTDSGDSSATTRPIFRPFAPVSSPSRVFPSLAYILNNANIPPATVNGVQTAENLSSVSRTLNFGVTIRDNRSGGGGVADDAVALTVAGGAGPFLVTSPNTAVSWTGGTTQTVNWSVNGTNLSPVNCASVRITLSTDGGATFPTVLLASTANDGGETVTVPNGVFSSTARIKVEAVGNIFFDICDASFTITPGSGAPAVSAISPLVGVAGDSVVITGINFLNGGTGPVSAVRFAGNANASFTINSDTQITTTVPAGAATGALTISKPGFSDIQTPSYLVCYSSPASLQADDGGFESASRFGSTGSTTYYVNRLTPAGYPATLRYVTLRWEGFQVVNVGTSITVLAGANADGDASVDNTSFQSAGTTVPSLGQFINFPITPITITSGDFVVGFSTPYSSSNFPILTDTTSPHQSRSYVSAGGSSFSLVTDRDYAIRASVYVGACSSGGCAPVTISSHPANQAVCAGAPASFSVTPGGTGPFTYQWRKGGANIPTATGSSYSIASTVAGDAGGYDVVVTGSCGTATSNNATLTVSALPVVSTHPASRVVCAGETATFTAAATGAPPPGTQWQVSTDGGTNFTNISGATSGTLTLPGVTPAQNGYRYRAVFSNGCTASSSAAVLTVASCSLSSGSLSVPASGETGSAGVTAPSGAAWTATGNAAWITITSGASGSGNGTVNFSVPSSGAPARTGTMTIAGQTFTVDQASGCAVTVSPSNSSLPTGRAAESYSQTFTASGATSPAFSVSGGALPNGLTLASGGALSGAPTAFGTFNFTVLATDTNGCTGSRAYTLVIDPPCAAITIAPATLNSVPVGVNYSQALSQTGGTGPIAWTISAGSPPSGISLDGSTGLLSGLPNTPGSFSFTVRATGANGCMGTRQYTLAISGPGLQFYPLAYPIRLLDTRAGLSGCDVPGAQIPGGTSRTQTIAGRTCSGLTIPANARAITGNVTTVQSGGGFLTLFPSDASRPNVANSNYGANEILNNVFTVGLGPGDGAFKIYVTTNTDVVVDVTGYYAPPEAAGLYFHPLPRPVRLLDTRAGLTACYTPGTPLPGVAETTQQATGACAGLQIPANARAIVGNATTVSSLGAGYQYFTLFPANATRPMVASSNYPAGQVMNGPFTAGLSPTGAFKIYPTSQTHLVIDVLGYYSSDATDENGSGLLYYPLPRPARLLDTRAGFSGCYTTSAPLAAMSTRTQPARGVCDMLTVPADAAAIVGNATVVQPGAGGWLTFWPSDATKPTAAASNYSAGQVFNRHFIVRLGDADGAFNLFTQAATHLVVDLSGFFAP